MTKTQEKLHLAYGTIGKMEAKIKKLEEDLANEQDNSNELETCKKELEAENERLNAQVDEALDSASRWRNEADKLEYYAKYYKEKYPNPFSSLTD